jgi:pentatricopeptide repeat protein
MKGKSWFLHRSFSRYRLVQGRYIDVDPFRFTKSWFSTRKSGGVNEFDLGAQLAQRIVNLADSPRDFTNIFSLLDSSDSETEITLNEKVFHKFLHRLIKSGNSSLAVKLHRDRRFSSIFNKNIPCKSLMITAFGQTNNFNEALNSFHSCNPKDSFALNNLLQACINCGQYETATKTFTHPDYSQLANVVTYTIALKAYGKLKRLDEAVQLYHSMEEKGIPPNERSLANMLNIFFEQGEYQRAIDFFQSQTNRKVKPDVVTSSIIMRCYGKQGNVKKAIELYEWMVSNKVPIDQRTICTILQVCIDNNSYEESIQLYEQIKDKDITSNQIIWTAYAKLGRKSEALKFRDPQIKDTVALDKFGSDTLLKTYLRSGNFQDALSLYDNKTNLNQVFPDIQLFTEFLHTCAESDKPETAIKLFHNTVPSIYGHNVFLYAGAIKAYGKLGQVHDAFRLYDILLSENILPNSRILNDLLNVCIENDDCKLAINLFLAAHHNRIADVVTCNLVIKAYGRLNQLSDAINLYKSMPSKHLIPAETSLNAILMACLENHAYSRAIHLFYEWKQTQTQTQPNETSYILILKAYGKSKQVTEALNLFYSLFKSPIKPTSQIFSVLLTVCSDAGQYDTVIKLFINPLYKKLHDVTAYNIVIKVYGMWHKVGNAIRLYDSMAQSNIRPDQHTVSAILQACIKNNASKRAIEIFSTISAPNLINCNIAMNAYGKVGRLIDAVELFRSLINEKRADSYSFDTILRQCYENRDYALQIRIYEEFQKTLKSTSESYNKVISGYIRLGRYSNAKILLKTANNNQMKIYRAVFNSLLEAYLDGGQYESLIELFEDPQFTHIKGAVSYSTAINAYGKLGKVDQAVKTFELMIPNGVDLNSNVFTSILDVCMKHDQYEVALALFEDPQYQHYIDRHSHSFLSLAYQKLGKQVPHSLTHINV